MDESELTTPSAPLTLINRLRFLQRQTVLLFVLVGLTVGAFFLTRSLAAMNRSLHHGDAVQWYQIGQRRLAEGDAAGAITALRRAAGADERNREVRFTLANAYLAAGDRARARDVLLELRRRLPDDAETNLRLARLEAASGGTQEGIRYYQAALLSLWGPQQLELRRELRIEFIEFLLDRGLEPRALSEALLLAGEMPDTPEAQIRVGELLRRAGDPARALKRFEAALKLAPSDGNALLGAGEAAFASGNFRLARTYLSRAPDSPSRRSLAPVVDLIVALDPLMPGIGGRERHARISRAAGQLAAEIETCVTRHADAVAIETDLDSFRTALLLRRTDEPVDADLAVLAALSDRASHACGGADTPLHRAIDVIARQHGTDQ